MLDSLERYRKIYAGIFEDMRIGKEPMNTDKYILMYRLAYHSIPIIRWGKWFKYKDEHGDFRFALNMRIDYAHPLIGVINVSAN